MIGGATPAGVERSSEAEVSRNIRHMFGRVAPRYDLLNRLLSFRIDQYWRRAVVRRVRLHLTCPEVRVLDLCCGTGDLLIALEAERRRLQSGGGYTMVGADFCGPMLQTAARKVERRGLSAGLLEADALDSPMLSSSFDLITIAYGFRNLANYQAGLQEMFRLLRPGGCLVILEFSQPRNRVFGALFEFYFRSILPRIGNTISGSGGAYSYLQQSVQKFLTPQELAAAMTAAGFGGLELVALTGGVSYLHLGYKGNPGGS